MSTPFVEDFLLRCLILNYAVLLVWFAVFVFAHAWLRSLHQRWFLLSEERFDAIHYLGMSIYKVGILLLNLTPYVALRLANHGG